MRELYNEFFHIPKNGKIREKVMLTHIAITITIVFVCLVAMSISAYAYFSYNVSSSSGAIKAANFVANISISVTENDSSTPIEVTRHKDASCSAELIAGKIYTITLDESEDSMAKTGFCILSAIGCPDIYHSQQIGADAAVEGEFTDKVTFQLTVTEDTTITFVSHWGTSSHYTDFKNKSAELYITQNETIKMRINEPDIEEDNGSNDKNGLTGGTTAPNQTDPSTTPSTIITTPSDSTGASETTKAPEPVTTEAATTEAATTEAVTTEAATTEPATTEPATTEPATTEAATTEAATTEPATTEAATTEAATTEPATTEAATTEPATTEAATTEAPTTEATIAPENTAPEEITESLSVEESIDTPTSETSS